MLRCGFEGLGILEVFLDFLCFSKEDFQKRKFFKNCSVRERVFFFDSISIVIIVIYIIIVIIIINIINRSDIVYRVCVQV
jgi:hypothetical protein